MKAIRVISNELIEIMEYKNPRICFNDYKLEDIENYCVFKETINPFQLYKELQRKDNITNKAINHIMNIFRDENWFKNYDYDDLATALKDTLGILRGDKE